MTIFYDMNRTTNTLLLAVLVGMACADSTQPGPPAAAIAIVAGDAQIALPGATVPIAPSVRVTDASGNAVAGVAVAFTSAGASVLSGPSQTTDANGVATAGFWRLGLAPGTHRIRATVTGVSGLVATFNASATATEVVAGYFHSCALTVTGAAFCWGQGGDGQLGDGSLTNRSSPGAAVSGDVVFQHLVAGAGHTCGLTALGAVYCWGDNGAGMLGDGTTISRAVPVPVVGGLVFQRLSASAFQTCGLTAVGNAYCWGANLNGGIGDGTTVFRSSPTAVGGGKTFQDIAVGARYACGLTVAGVAWCWGDNANGQLGDGTTTMRTAPVAVSGGLIFQSLHAADHHTCGLSEEGTVYCWGDNLVGQLGDGTTTRRVTPVATTLGATRFQSMTAGGIRTTPPVRGHTCGLTTSGSAYCWGDNEFGAVGDGTLVDRTGLVTVAGGLTFESIVANALHTCGLTTQKVVYCWGYNPFGQVGNGTSTTAPMPARVGPQ